MVTFFPFHLIPCEASAGGLTRQQHGVLVQGLADVVGLARQRALVDLQVVAWIRMPSAGKRSPESPRQRGVRHQRFMLLHPLLLSYCSTTHPSKLPHPLLLGSPLRWVSSPTVLQHVLQSSSCFYMWFQKSSSALLRGCMSNPHGSVLHRLALVVHLDLDVL